jgi:hypothetical protein
MSLKVTTRIAGTVVKTAVAKVVFVGALAAVMGCAPGLAGGWDASGHTGVASPFDLDLTFHNDAEGLAVFGTVDSGEKAVPVCNASLKEGRVTFVIDTKGGKNCSTLEHPLSFDGQLGRDVIVGKIADVGGKEVGVFRAYRKADK